MELLYKKILTGLLIVIAVLVAVIFLWLGSYQMEGNNINLPATVGAVNSGEVKEEPKKQLEEHPKIIKAVYVTGWSAGSAKYITYLNSLLDTTEINAVVIDIKDGSGLVSYQTDIPAVNQYKTYYPKIKDINGLIKILHEKNIYVIGRIVVFEDNALAKARPDLAIYDKSATADPLRPVPWNNHGGISWVDPASKEVQDYNIELAKDGWNRGFDEINFDYIRFPTDGDTANVGFPVWDGETLLHLVIKDFFQNLRQSLPGVIISADLFGQVTVSKDDMGVGQLFEDSLEYFDYVEPMVYPSHYEPGFLGYESPVEHPYEVIKNAIGTAQLRRMAYLENNARQDENGNDIELKLAKIRPWIQDFDLGADYNAEMIIKEIDAVKDSLGEDFSGFMMWNPLNRYTEEAIKVESQDSSIK